MVQAQQHEGLDELGLDGRGPHGEDGLPREDGGALRHGPDVAGETELAQIVQEGLGKAALGAEVGDVLLVKAQLLDILDDLGQPRRYSKASLVRDRAEEHVKVADALAQSGLEVPVAHSQLVEVAEHGHVQLFFCFHPQYLKSVFARCAKCIVDIIPRFSILGNPCRFFRSLTARKGTVCRFLSSTPTRLCLSTAASYTKKKLRRRAEFLFCVSEIQLTWRPWQP